MPCLTPDLATRATSVCYVPSLSEASVLAAKVISVKVAVQPSPVGDCARKPASNASSSTSPKWRTNCQWLPSCEKWNAHARPILATRSQIVFPSTTAELQSSETPCVTTETTIGSPSGEYSKH